MATGITDAGALRVLARLLEPCGALWVNAIRMTLVPLVVSLLVTSVASFSDARAVGRLGGRTVALFLALLIGAAILTAIVAPPLFERMPGHEAAAAAGRAFALAPDRTDELPTVRGFIVGLVPTNPVQAAARGDMLPLIVFTLLFALATTRLPAAARAQVTGLFQGIGAALLIVVGWILRATPLGVFALSVNLGADLGLGVVGAVGSYIVIVCVLLVVVTLALYPIVALGSPVSMRRFARAAAPAQAVAAGTRSSLASLPALIDGARREFGERPGLTGFVLPLGVSTFKLNTPVSDLIGPLFLAALLGIDLTPGQIATMTLVTIAMSFSNPGVPSGGLFVVTAPVMMSVGLPLEGIGLLIAADAIPDLFATVTNVTGDMAVAALVSPAAEPAGEVG